jgi:hypothetical protein
MEIYCLHHSPAKERKEKLLKDFDHHNLEVKWIESYEPTTELKNQFPCRKTKMLTIYGVTNDVREIENRELSLFLKHREAINSANGPFIVLEDDIVLPKEWDMGSYFLKCLDEFNTLQGDILNIGTAFNFRPSKIVDDKLVYYEPYFRTRCAHAYSISEKSLSVIREELKIIDNAFDWKLNDIIEKHQLRSCYVEPGLHQQSLIGGMKSLLR